MTVYEVGLPDHYDDDSNDGCDCTLWIACDHPLRLTDNARDNNFYVKEIEIKDAEHTPGVDIIIE